MSPEVHVLSGYDYNSKFTTKLAALNAIPVKSIDKFGLDHSLQKLMMHFRKAEVFLVQVLHDDDMTILMSAQKLTGSKRITMCCHGRAHTPHEK